MKWILRLAYLYLTLPFLIFCMGWLRLPVALPIAVVILWGLLQLLKQTSSGQFTPLGLRTTVYCLLLTGIWVFLSGVGGYAFQNWDHHWRNAVFRDLITHTWPVYYSAPERGPITMLVYYVGYWLPAALVGRALGWQAANFALFLWTWLGAFLVVTHLGAVLKTSPIKAALLIIFFGGLDALGALLFAKEYPTLLPPITHLEIWAGSLQYSSFTTQLFWVFNQAVPAWLCILLIMSTVGKDAGTLSQKGLLWALSFFFAPLVSAGLIPYLLIDIFKMDFKSLFKSIRLDLLSASVIIVLLSYFFFSANTAAQQRGFQPLALEDWLAFFLLDGGILWILLAPSKWRDPRWAVTGLLLLVIPFVQFGNGQDFVMRASIAPLFYLMLMTGETILHNKTSRLLRFAFYVLLFIGVLTPLYEINRSIHRTSQYYFVLDETQRIPAAAEPATTFDTGGAPEAEHPNALAADQIFSFVKLKDKLARNFVANVRQTFYYRYLAKR